MKNTDLSSIDENTIAYLQMIQMTVDRMSTTSAIFKGFCATIITGISAVSFTEINKWILLLAILPVICFFVLDVYYLQLERRFRALYNSVRNGVHNIDFDLTPPKARELKCSEASVWFCLKSPSIYLFYIPALLISITVVVIKFTNII